MSHFDHDGTRFNFDVIGEGIPVVFCHGLGGDLNQPKDLIGELKGIKLYLLDCRSHGLTEPTGSSDKLNFSTFAEDIAAFINHFGVDKPVIAGISMGAGVSVAFAVRYPKMIRAMVLIRPAWLNFPSPPNLRLLENAGQLMRDNRIDIAQRLFKQKPEIIQIARFSPSCYESLIGQFSKPKAYERANRLLYLTHSTPIESWSEVARLDVPTLILANRNDIIHPYGYAKIWAKHLTTAKIVEIPSKNTDAKAHRIHVQLEVAAFLNEVCQHFRLITTH